MRQEATTSTTRGIPQRVSLLGAEEASRERNMDEVLKRLTSKMNSSSLTEELKRSLLPPCCTPVHQLKRRAEATDGIRDGSAFLLKEALTEKSFAEKERRLSEMIVQLQMVREQLLAQQSKENVIQQKPCLPILSRRRCQDQPITDAWTGMV
ncbi:hypothetical protein J437_LFUL019175 [Ladona fulva]|uniref:Uncharacterized protein n=1 Tax=Ladona fulva TaxID=123851 RepID=A0A8K0PAL8_LADFU|nr:hypothetical protein J437_LFUL019175 [Ladona fulva]